MRKRTKKKVKTERKKRRKNPTRKRLNIKKKEKSADIVLQIFLLIPYARLLLSEPIVAL